MPTTQITLRNVDPELSRRLRAVSAERGESLNSTVLRLLKDAVGLDARRDRLRRYVTWTADDLSEFTDALRAQRVVDERYWQ
jgi:plasmid stability protein